MEGKFIQIDPIICVGCGVCGEVCPFGLPNQNEFGRFSIRNPIRCVGCSACARNCPASAIKLDEQKGCGCIWCDDLIKDRKNAC